MGVGVLEAISLDSRGKIKEKMEFDGGGYREG